MAVMPRSALLVPKLALLSAILVLGGCYSVNGNYEANDGWRDGGGDIRAPEGTREPVTVSVGNPSDLWLPDLPLVEIRRGNSESGYGYEVWFLVGDTQSVQFWTRGEIDFGDGVTQHADRWGMFHGQRVRYPVVITAESAPRIHEAIVWVEQHYRGQAKGGISAMEMFGVIAAVGSLAPTGGGAASASAGQAATKALPAGRGVWVLGWAERGRRIEQALGSNLPANFPVIDRFTNGVATSIKSLDLSARTYQRSGRLHSQVKRYITKLARFDGARWRGSVIESGQTSTRILELVVPHAGNLAQRKTLVELAAYARRAGVELKVIVYP